MSTSNINNDIEDDNRESGHGKNLNLTARIKRKWLKVSITFFASFLLVLIISWILTVFIGIKAVEKEYEVRLKYLYEKSKEAYIKDPKLGERWSTPCRDVSRQAARFWKKKLFIEKRFPSFEEWKKFQASGNSISYSAFLPLRIKVNYYRGDTVWMREYYFWYLWGLHRYKREHLADID